MANLIARTEEENDELYSWADGESLTVGDSITVGSSEVAVVWDGEKAILTLGPGRHAVSAESMPALTPLLEGEGTVFVCFVTTSTFDDLEIEGALTEEDEPTEEDLLRLTVALRVSEPDKLVSKLVEIESLVDEDEEVEEDELPTLEDWIAEELLVAASDRIAEGAAESLAADLPGLVAAPLGAAGVTLVRVDKVELPKR